MQSVFQNVKAAAVGPSIMAELVFLDPPPINFARLVSDLDTGLARLHDSDRQLVWDCEDIAIFDFPGTRIALAYAEEPRAGIAASLTLSVGPSHLPAALANLDAPFSAHSSLCSKLVERVQSRLLPNAVFWHETEILVTADLIDDLATTEPQARARPTANHPIYQSPEVGRLNGWAETDASGVMSRGQMAVPHDTELSRVRAALYPESYT